MADLTGKTLGKYHILQRLGQGGMAEVYLARQAGLERNVAIKVMHAHLAADEAFVGRFQREAQAVAELHHPHIVQIYDYDAYEGMYYMVMEYIPGETLSARLARLQAEGKRMPVEEVVRILRAVCDALDYAHRLGQVHRDVKPGNILFDGDRPVLADFGLATIAGGQRYTLSGAMVGTPAYIAPEMARGLDGDARSDVYSLGVMLYEMVTGQLPYDAGTGLALAMKHVLEPLTPPRMVAADCSPALESVIMGALKKSPDERFTSAAELSEALETAVRGPDTTPFAGEILPVASETSTEQPASQTTARRSRGRTWLLFGFLGLALLLGMITILLLLSNVRQHEKQAEHRATASSLPAALPLAASPTLAREPSLTPPGEPSPTPLSETSPTSLPVAVRPFPDTTDGVHVFSDQLAYWNMSEAQFKFAATHYDGSQKLTRPYIDLLRTYNPDFVLLNYRLGLGLGYQTPDKDCQPTGDWVKVVEGSDWVQEYPDNPPDEWFFQWQGRRVYNCDWGWYVMNPDNASWRAHWTGEVLRQLQASNADGVFVDSFGPPSYFGADRYSPPLPALDKAFESDWSQRISNFLSYIQAGPATDYRFIANVGQWVVSRDITDYSLVNGVMVEEFGGWGFGEYFDPLDWDWQLQMDRILGMVRQDKIVLMQQQVDAENVADRLFLLGSYLLVKGRYTYLNLFAVEAPEWFPEYEIPIGSPVEPAPEQIEALWSPEWSLYARHYSNGLVLVNPTATAQTVKLPATYYQAIPQGGGPVPADGDVSIWNVEYLPVEEVTVEPNRAVVLLKTAP